MFHEGKSSEKPVYKDNKKQEEMRWVNMMSLYLNTGLYHIGTFLLMVNCIMQFQPLKIMLPSDITANVVHVIG